LRVNFYTIIKYINKNNLGKKSSDYLNNLFHFDFYDIYSLVDSNNKNLIFAENTIKYWTKVEYLILLN